MEISNLILSTYKAGPESGVTRSKEVKKGKSASVPRGGDVVEISANAKEKRYAEIRNRIKSGFYNSTAVRDDLSDKLTTVLDKITG